MYAAVQFQNPPASGLLVQTVNILRDDRRQFPRPLQFGELSVGGIGLHVGNQHLVMVETVNSSLFLR